MALAANLQSPSVVECVIRDEKFITLRGNHCTSRSKDRDSNDSAVVYESDNRVTNCYFFGGESLRPKPERLQEHTQRSLCLATWNHAERCRLNPTESNWR